MPYSTVAARASVALVLAALSAPAFAGSVPSQSETVINARAAGAGEVVMISESDLGGARAQSSLLGRIHIAAVAACDAHPGVTLDALQGYNYCVDTLVADARIAMPSRTDLAARGGSVRMILR